MKSEYGIVLHIVRLALFVELFRSFGVMIKRYLDYEMSKLEKLLDDIDKRNEK